jgi:hypothetical protein
MTRAGAGSQTDLRTFAALGVYGTSAITAVTAQHTSAVSAVHAIPAEVVAAQIDAVLEDIGAGAVKTGMLFSASIMQAVADAVLRHGVHNLVIDPVMVAKSGDRLLQEDAVQALRSVLLPQALVVTPNLPEAEALTGLSLTEALGAPGADRTPLLGEAARRIRARPSMKRAAPRRLPAVVPSWWRVTPRVRKSDRAGHPVPLRSRHHRPLPAAAARCRRPCGAVIGRMLLQECFGACEPRTGPAMLRGDEFARRDSDILLIRATHRSRLPLPVCARTTSGGAAQGQERCAGAPRHAVIHPGRPALAADPESARVWSAVSLRRYPLICVPASPHAGSHRRVTSPSPRAARRAAPRPRYWP